jgi:hypothetical protein
MLSYGQTLDSLVMSLLTNKLGIPQKKQQITLDYQRLGNCRKKSAENKKTQMEKFPTKKL